MHTSDTAFDSEVAKQPLVAAGFRPDIEGLRGVAVLAVVAYHAFPGVLPGGYFGVDVFFVISGYLITQMLCRELHATGRIDLLEFWARRIRRIAPASATVLLAVALVGFCFPDAGGRQFGRDIAAAALSYFNWQQVAHSVGYLAHDDGLNPVLHYWSLSVEEQFYLIWPLALLGLSVLFGRGLWVAATGLLCASLCAAVYLAPLNEPLAFFGTATRAWQLLIGALAAMLPVAENARRVAVLGGILVAAAFVAGTAPTYNPALAVVPTLGAAVLLSAGAGLLRGLLVSAPLAYTGRVSFSLYLWHWPLLVLLPATSAGVVAALAATFVLAAASYRFIERPVRESRLLMRSVSLTYLLGVGLVGAAVAAGVGLATLGRDTRPVIYSDGCLLSHASVTDNGCAYAATDGRSSVVLFGDSIAGNWFDAIEEAANRQGWRLLVRVKAACAPIEDLQQRSDGSAYTECAAWRHRVLREMSASPPALVIVSAIRAGSPAGERAVLDRLSRVAPTVVLRSTPILPTTPQRCLRAGECAWPSEGLVRAASYPATPARDLPEGVHLLDLNGLVCPGGVCRAARDGRSLMIDDRHFTASFSRSFAPAFVGLLQGFRGDTLVTGRVDEK